MTSIPTNSNSRFPAASSWISDRTLLYVILLSGALTIIHALYLWRLPPLDADAYEYAGVARNLIRHHALIHTNIPSPGYVSPIRDLPQPAFDRVTLWTFLISPFQFLLGDSVWVFLIPFLLSSFFLGPAVYHVALRVFSQKIAFASAVTTMLLPRIVLLSTREDPGQPNLFVTILFLLAILFFLERRWIRAGLVTGITVLTRLTGIVLIPVFLVWSLLFNRKAFTSPRFYAGLILAVAIGSPLFLRNTIIMGNRYGSLPAATCLTADPVVLERFDSIKVFTDFVYPGAETGEPPRISLKDRILYPLKNLSSSLRGAHSGVAWYPGIPELISPLLFPFLLIGLWDSRKRRHRFLLTIFFFSVPLLYSLKFGYEDRYLFPVVIVGIMLAYQGVELLSKRIHWISVTRVLLLFLALEAVPHFVQRGMELTDANQAKPFRELQAIAGWVQEETLEEAVFMTMPFWSPHYILDRKTVLPPLGGMESWKRVVEDYQVDYFLYQRILPGDLFPRFSFLTPLIQGEYFSLFQLDRDHPDFQHLRERYAYIMEFDLLREFLMDRTLPGEGTLHTGNPTTLGSYEILLGNRVMGWLCYGILCCAGLAALNLPGRKLRILGWILLALTATVIRFSSLMALGARADIYTPPVNPCQAKGFLHHGSSDGGRQHLLVLDGKGDMASVSAFFHAEGRSLIVLDDSFRGALAPGEILFLHIEEPAISIPDREGAWSAYEKTGERNRIFADAEEALREKGLLPEIIAGGLFATVPQPGLESMGRPVEGTSPSGYDR